ncbi:YitT family protein [Liquorilactobacillus sicerae]|uniref:YitT family protein n=1 Tax=Liquorilactobacillus sicerae TaxID=1416943 RepID=UPI0024803D6B|nr:YitT family protein [Liquorilactobacillus sicerae]
MSAIKIKKNLSQWCLLLIGLELITLSINFFFAPIDVAAGGATGIAILLNAVWGINRAATVLVINVAMIMLAAFFLDTKVIRKISAGSFILPGLLYLNPSFKLVDDPLLAVTIGGTVFAAGIATLYRINASSGGTTVPPLILKKYFHLNPAISLLAFDMLVTLFNIPVAGVNSFFLAAFSLVITSLVMRYIEAGLDHKYQIQIVSQNKIDQIRQMLLTNQESVTIYQAEGGFSTQNKEVLLVVTDDLNYGNLIHQIHQIDSEAFIITSNVVKVHGGRWGM